ncbi:Amino acid transporter AVT1B [Hondaea fermentalgiana]|uniref:Amino acid transporter AVT1B n=1 Tax=Hondaea fermentalgiana TaxID=2315210 RepID=A0A2R5G7A9_9STRA|nr:Amino acid transporter AVT1B [Hondaea fermentalgiana]|eukprot:GBG24343.1 Amino acid transporter AVT1B [Hondaea fermentalgiana]
MRAHVQRGSRGEAGAETSGNNRVTAAATTPGHAGTATGASNPTMDMLFKAFPRNFLGGKAKAHDDAPSPGSAPGTPSGGGPNSAGGSGSINSSSNEIPDEGLWPKGNKAKSNRPRKFSYGDMLSTQQAFWHCMTLVLGLGTLTIPYVLKELGWFGLVLLALLAWLSAYTAKLLCICIDYVPEATAGRDVVKVLNTYPDIGEAAFGARGRTFVNYILYIDLVASSALFLVFIATNMAEMLPGLFTPSVWILVTGISLLPTVLLKLQKLTFLSAIGSYIMLALVVAVLYAAISTAPESLEKNEYHMARFQVQAAGNMIFAFAMHGTLLTIYRDMRSPNEAGALFDKVYATGYLLKFLVGATGYYLFAQNTSDQVTLNLPIPWLKTVITLAVTLKKWLTYALPLEPVAVELEQRSNGRSALIRVGLVVLTVIMAIFLPYFGLFQSLIGSLCAGFLVLIFPLAFYLKLYGKTNLSARSRFFHWALLILSVILVVLASYRSLEEAFMLWWDTDAVVIPSDSVLGTGASVVPQDVKDAAQQGIASLAQAADSAAAVGAATTFDENSA